MNDLSCGVRTMALCFCLGASLAPLAQAQNAVPAQSALDRGEQLKLVVMVSRHGVRSPTAKPGQLNRYSAAPWPEWSVPPGYLTAHGAHLMTLFGAYDRELMAAEGLLAPQGCADAGHIRIVADSDQRTRETGKALAEGLAPGCAIEVSALAEGTPDPLFHSLHAGAGQPDKLLATAAICGRIGADPQGLVEAYRPQLEALEDILRACHPGAACANSGKAEPESIFAIPSSIAPGKGDHLVELRSPLGVASSMAEDLLLEYAEGMDAASVGWGRVDLNKLRELLQLHEAQEDIAQRTGTIARIQSSNLLFHILRSMEEEVAGHPVTGALTRPGDRLLILVGHDTNIANIGGALDLSWLVDGRRNDTPPGGALVFELWKSRATGEYSVRAFYMAQTLDQMRNDAPLSLGNPPDRVPIFVPGCSGDDSSCKWSAFQQLLKGEIDAAFVK